MAQESAQSTCRTRCRCPLGISTTAPPRRPHAAARSCPGATAHQTTTTPSDSRLPSASRGWPSSTQALSRSETMRAAALLTSGSATRKRPGPACPSRSWPRNALRNKPPTSRWVRGEMAADIALGPPRRQCTRISNRHTPASDPTRCAACRSSHAEARRLSWLSFSRCCDGLGHQRAVHSARHRISTPDLDRASKASCRPASVQPLAGGVSPGQWAARAGKVGGADHGHTPFFGSQHQSLRSGHAGHLSSSGRSHRRLSSVRPRRARSPQNTSAPQPAHLQPPDHAHRSRNLGRPR
jgi:hypothetical protein